MWYEALPAVGAFILVTYLPHVLMPLYEKLVYGNRYLKDTGNQEVLHFWFRDMNLTGNGNIPTDCSAIPDLPEEKM